MIDAMDVFCAELRAKFGYERLRRADEESWFPRKAYCAPSPRSDRAKHRKRLRQEIADALRIALAAKAAGFPIRAATIGGIQFEFGEPESATAPPGNELDQWLAKHPERNHARSSERH
jgi:hypothetical protein